MPDVKGDQFIEDLNSAMVKSSGALLTALQNELIQPGEINQDKSFKFFKRLNSIDITQVRLYDMPDYNEDDDSILHSSSSTKAPGAAPGEWDSGVPGTTGVSSNGGNEGPLSILSGDTLKEVDPNIWIGAGVGVGLLFLIIAGIVVYCCFFRWSESGKDSYTDDDDESSSPHEEEPGERFQSHRTKRPQGRSLSLDESYMRSNVPESQGVQRTLRRPASFDDYQRQSPMSHVSNGSPPRLVKRAQSSNGAVFAGKVPTQLLQRAKSSDVLRGTVPNRPLQRANTSNGAVFREMVRQPPLQHSPQPSLLKGNSFAGVICQESPQQRRPRRSLSGFMQDQPRMPEDRRNGARTVQMPSTVDPSLKQQPIREDLQRPTSFAGPSRPVAPSSPRRQLRLDSIGKFAPASSHKDGPTLSSYMDRHSSLSEHKEWSQGRTAPL